MAKVQINYNQAIALTENIAAISRNLETYQNTVSGMQNAAFMDGAFREEFNRSLRQIETLIVAEAAKLNSFDDALKSILEDYRRVEQEVNWAAQANKDGINTQGTDKRGLFKRLWDWITGREPDDYDTTTLEQERAADEYMRTRLWEVLQNERYSPETWDRASIEERKAILQEYMNEVARIYGLRDVNTTIRWDADDMSYSRNSITWGYYNHSSHTVSLNAEALSDRISTWDSYDLLETVAHELRHAYQHEAVDHPTDYMVSQETLGTWRYNIDHYINSSTDYDAYRAQPIEVDARSFQVNRNSHP